MDYLGGNGGLLAASLECPIGKWAERIHVPNRLPLPSLPWSTIGWRLTAGLAFAIIAMAVPVYRRAVSAPTPVMDISAETAALQEKLQALEEHQALPENLAEELRKELDKLQNDNDGRQAAQTLEQLEQLNGELEQAVTEMERRQAKAAETSEMLAELAELLQAHDGDAMQAAALNRQFQELMQSMAAENPSLQDLMKTCCENGQMPSGKELAEALRRLGKPGDSQSGQRDNSQQSLRQWLQENAPESCSGLCEMAEAAAKEGEEGEPDAEAVGVSRGRGDAPLDYTGLTADANGPRQDVGVEVDIDPEQSRLQGQFAVAPQAEETAAAPQAGTLSVGTGGLKHHERIIRPEHQAIVRKYFNP